MADAVGYSLAVAVTALGTAGRLAGLSPAAISCLHVMALNARDRPSKTEAARTYFAGWDHLSRAALGRLDYDAAAERAVARAVRELIDAGHVKPIGRRNGVRQGAVMYELLFGELP
jgi:hypothetical protein